MNNKTINTNSAETAKLSGFTSDSVHVMPEQFYEKPPEKKKGVSFWTILLIVLIVLIVAGIGVLVFFVFTRNIQSQTINTQPAQNETAVTVNSQKQTNNQIIKQQAVTATTEQTSKNTAEEVKEPTQVVTNNSKTDPVKTIDTASTEEKTAKVTISRELKNGNDTDKDGLTDAEEAVFSTQLTKPDSDGDGFLDGEELMGLFDPLQPSPALLESSEIIQKYENKSYNYSIFYPAKWSARALDQTNREVIFTSSNGDFIEVLIEDNPELYSAKTWYLKHFPDITSAQVKTITTRDGMQGVKSVEGTTAYFSNGYLIYAITYNIGTKTVLDYNSAYEMMIKSFKVGINNESND